MKKNIGRILAVWLLASAAGAAMPVNLGKAGNFSILAKTGVSTVGTTSVTGNIGLAPASASYLTGFGLIADASNEFATSSLVVGRVYAADYSAPTPANMTAAIGDMQTAYTDAAGRAAGVTELGAGSIGGMTLSPGVYSWGTGVLVASDLTLSGGSGDVWIFQIAQTLDVSNGIHVNLIGGARPENIFWQVAGQVTLGTTSVLNGNVLGQTAIVLNTGATLNGKAMAQSAVTLDASKVKSSTGDYFGSNPPSRGQTFAYPSPVRKGFVNLVYKMVTEGKATIKVWNENGDLVATQEDSKLVGVQRSLIPVADFASGVYLYQVRMRYDSGATEDSDVQKFAVSK